MIKRFSGLFVLIVIITGCGNNKTPVEKQYTQVLSDSLQRIVCDSIINELGMHKADTFGPVTSIPKDFEGCLDQLDDLTSEEMKQWIRCLPDGDFSAKVHFGLGMHLRNSWGLWSGSELSKNLLEMGIRHPDDMTGIIFDSYQRRLKGEDIKLDEQIRYYQDYWEKTEMPKDSLLE